MDIYIPQEFIIPIVATGAGVIAAFLVLLRNMFKHIGTFATTLESHAKVNAALNTSWMAEIEARKADRAQWEQERAALDQQRIADRHKFEARLDALEATNAREITRLQAALKAENEARTKGEQENRLEIQRLKDRIHELEAEKARLAKERDGWRQTAQELEAKVNELSDKVQKLEKRDTGPLTDSAARAAAAEPGEGAQEGQSDG